jgi:hypothetical protein
MQEIGSGGKQLTKGKTMIHSVRGRVSQTPRSRPKSFLWRQCRTPFVKFCKIEGELQVPDAILDHMTTFICKAGQWCSSQVYSREKCNKAARQRGTWHTGVSVPMIGRNRQLVTDEPVEFEK